MAYGGSAGRTLRQFSVRTRHHGEARTHCQSPFLLRRASFAGRLAIRSSNDAPSCTSPEVGLEQLQRLGSITARSAKWCRKPARTIVFAVATPSGHEVAVLQIFPRGRNETCRYSPYASERCFARGPTAKLVSPFLCTWPIDQDHQNCRSLIRWLSRLLGFEVIAASRTYGIVRRV